MSRKGDWFSTYTGGRFYPLDFRPEDFRIEDIAHALSMRCRFRGHCKRFLSVAEHSVMVHDICKSKQHGLLHDAAEAYSDDLPRPIKRMPEFQVFTDLEQRINDVLLPAFGLDPTLPPDVKYADSLVLAYEIVGNMNTDTDPEAWQHWTEVLRDAKHYVELQYLCPQAAEQLFLDTFYTTFTTTK